MTESKQLSKPEVEQVQEERHRNCLPRYLEAGRAKLLQVLDMYAYKSECPLTMSACNSEENILMLALMYASISQSGKYMEYMWRLKIQVSITQSRSKTST